MNIQFRLGVLLIAFTSFTTFAGSIGFNFVGAEGGKAQTMREEDEAGVVAQKFWNNVKTSNDDPNGHANRGKQMNVADAAGKAIKGMSLTIEATKDTQVFPANGATWGFEGAALTLRTGHAHPTPKITITGIPYKHYDVYIYLAAGDAGGQGSVAISLPKGIKGAVDKTATYFYNFKWEEGKDVRAESKTLDDAKNGGGNYVQFTDNTAPAIVLDIDGKLAGGWTGVAAVQIVDTTPAKK